MDHDIKVTKPHIVYKVNLWVTMIYHSKYTFSGVNSLHNMKLNRWTIKYRWLTYINLTGQSDGHIDPLYQLWLNNLVDIKQNH